MGRIKKYRLGKIVYVFEVKDEIYAAPPKILSLTETICPCYLAEPGSVASYSYGRGPGSMIVTPVWDISLPKDECTNPTAEEILVYSNLKLV